MFDWLMEIFARIVFIVAIVAFILIATRLFVVVAGLQ